MSDWYYAVNNEQKGPVNEAQLKELLASARIPAQTLVWRDGMENWTPAAQVPALSSREPVTTVTLTPSPTTVAHAPGAHNPESATPVAVSSLIGTGEALEVDADDAENNKIFGILAYLIVLWWLPLVAAKNSPFAKYHANQGFVLFILFLAVVFVQMIANGILEMLRVYSLEWIFSLLLLPIIYLLVVGIINAAAGKCVPLPVVGKFKLIK